MTVKEILKEWLTTNGYDGLYSDECGCEIDDLVSCGNSPSLSSLNDPFLCEPGHKTICDCGDHNWHIGP